MSESSFARKLSPPYYAVIFTSQRRDGEDGYGEMADRMLALAAEQPGFLGIESARDADGFGITVSYWDCAENISAWRKNAQHRLAQEHGKLRWYEHYEVRIAKVERAYSKRLENIG